MPSAVPQPDPLDAVDRSVWRVVCRAAHCFTAGEPIGWLRERGVGLSVRAAPLVARGRRVHGAWDPVLRRIELHGCDEGRPDFELVRVFGHELGHALGLGEAAAAVFSEAWARLLGPERVSACAGALRREAVVFVGAGDARFGDSTFLR